MIYGPTYMAKSRQTTLLVDADIVAYQHAASGQKTFHWDEGVTSIETPPIEETVAEARKTLSALAKKFHGTVYLVFSCPVGRNFRKDILPSYKSNRKGEKPVQYVELRAELSKHYKVYEKETLEGDDVMGMLATHPKLIAGRKIIVSIDKDMQQIPGELYNPGKDTLVKITKNQGNRYHMLQTLTGDATDGYKGCLGCGPIKAAKALANLYKPFERWEAVLQEYTDKGLTLEDALVQARVAKILQSEDYNFQTKEPILWQPPSSTA